MGRKPVANTSLMGLGSLRSKQDVLAADNGTVPRQQTNETVDAQPLMVYAAHAKHRGLLAPQQKGLFAAHVGVKLFSTN